MLALKPERGKPAFRNFREGDGNGGIIRSPLRAIALPDCRPFCNIVTAMILAKDRGGKTHCVPAAVSNSLVWLANNGFPSLQPFHDDDPQVAQARLVNMLGDVMGTSEHSGTSPFSASLASNNF